MKEELTSFAVLIPITTQIGYDTYKDSYMTLILPKELTFEQIMEKVKNIKPNVEIEQLHFTKIITE